MRFLLLLEMRVTVFSQVGSRGDSPYRSFSLAFDTYFGRRKPCDTYMIEVFVFSAKAFEAVDIRGRLAFAIVCDIVSLLVGLIIWDRSLSWETYWDELRSSLLVVLNTANGLTAALLLNSPRGVIDAVGDSALGVGE